MSLQDYLVGYWLIPLIVMVAFLVLPPHDTNTIVNGIKLSLATALFTHAAYAVSLFL